MPTPIRPAGDPRPDFVLVDFDGTLAAADVGNRFFRRFTSDTAAWDRLIEEWKAERVSARECLARECDLARVTATQAGAFAGEFSLAPDAVEFVAAARTRGHEVAVGSDGLAFYIEILLGAAGLELPFTANRLRFDGDRPLPEFGSLGPEVLMAGGETARAMAGAGPGCGECGNCKGARLRAAQGSGRYARVVLVGDGFSDRCAARVADLVYAKDDLLAWCLATGIAARRFTALADVARAEGWSPAVGFARPGAQPL